MVNLHFLTRCVKVNNLKDIKLSIYPTINFNVVWHILFDSKILKDIDVELLNELQSLGAKFYFKNLTASPYENFNEVIETLGDGFVCLLNEDNILYPLVS